MWLVLWLVRTWGLGDVVSSRSSTAWLLRGVVRPTRWMGTCYMCVCAHVCACMLLLVWGCRSLIECCVALGSFPAAAAAGSTGLLGASACSDSTRVGRMAADSRCLVLQ